MLKFPPNAAWNRKPESILNSYYRRLKSSKVFEFNPEEHVIVGETKDHHIYKCPFCIEVRGKADEDGKLYWNYQKLISYCFKCESVGVLKSDKPHHLLKLEMALNGLINELADNTDLIRAEINSLKEIKYSVVFTELDQRGRDYLNARNPIYTELADVFKFGVSNPIGLAVPVVIDNKIVSYILRYYNPTGKMKYYLPEGSKLIYSPTQEIYPGAKHSEVTLVEGSFDAIAATIDGFPTPLALFGKTITPLQIYLIRRLAPDRINIYMDETELSIKLKKKLVDHFPTVSQFRIIRSDNGFDAEEKLNWKLSRGDPDYLNKILENINKIRSTYEHRTNNTAIPTQ